MSNPTGSLTFVLRAGSETMRAKLDLSTTDSWLEHAAPLRDSVGPTSLVLWMASRKHGEGIWEIEWELSAAGCDPTHPDERATIVCIDELVVQPHMPAPADPVDALPLLFEHQNPRSVDATLATACVLPARRVICGRMAMGPEAEESALQEIAFGMPVVDAYTMTHFGPANWPLPMYDQSKQNAKWQGKFMALRSALMNDSTFEGEDWSDGIHPDALNCDWSTPYLELNEYAPGESGIWFLSGYQGLWHARYALLAHMLVAQRMKVAYNSRTGFQPLSVDDYVADSPFYDWRDNELPEFQNVRVIGTPVEPAYTAIHAHKDPDPEHDIRVQRKAIEGWEYFKSPLCRRHLLARAEDRRMIFSEKGPRPHDGWVPMNLRTLSADAARRPHEGAQVGRAFGWVMHAAAMLFKLRGANVSKGWKRWASLAQNWLSTCSMETGICGRYHVELKPDCMQAFEAVILAWGAYALEVQSKAAMGAWAKTAAHQLYRVMVQQDDAWILGAVGPFHHVFVAPAGGEPFPKLENGMASPSAQPGQHPGDITHKEPGCALAYRFTKDLTWFDTAGKTRGIEKGADYVANSINVLENDPDDNSCGSRAVVVSEWQRVAREGRR